MDGSCTKSGIFDFFTNVSQVPRTMPGTWYSVNTSWINEWTNEGFPQKVKFPTHLKYLISTKIK